MKKLQPASEKAAIKARKFAKEEKARREAAKEWLKTEEGQKAFNKALKDK